MTNYNSRAAIYAMFTAFTVMTMIPSAMTLPVV